MRWPFTQLVLLAERKMILFLSRDQTCGSQNWKEGRGILIDSHIFWTFILGENI